MYEDIPLSSRVLRYDLFHNATLRSPGTRECPQGLSLISHHFYRDYSHMRRRYISALGILCSHEFIFANILLYSVSRSQSHCHLLCHHSSFWSCPAFPALLFSLAALDRLRRVPHVSTAGIRLRLTIDCFIPRYVPTMTSTQ